MMTPVAIYKATNILNGKMYIGQSIHPERRFTEHRRGSKSKILSAAIKKHGKENFEFKILCWCPDKTYADMVEVKLIKAHDTRRVGYNICVGGEGLGSGADHPKFGKKATEETRRRIAAAKVGELNPHYGKPNSPEQKAKIRASLQGRENTWGAKVSAAKKGTAIHPNTVAARRKAAETRESGYRLVFTKRDEQVIAKSFAEAEKLLPVHDASIRRCLNGAQKKVAGWGVVKVPYGD
jgi:group I intron endonuclease